MKSTTTITTFIALSLAISTFLSLVTSSPTSHPLPIPAVLASKSNPTERSIGSSLLSGLESAVGGDGGNMSMSGALGAGLTASLGDHDTVIFQNGLMKNVRSKAAGGNGTAAPCPSMSILFARGTLEPGNVGILAGPAFFAAVGEYMNGTVNGLAIQGVDYPADVAGFFAGGSMTGAMKMASLVNSTLAACPNTRLTMSGYSQGAQVVHIAASMLSNDTMSKVASVVLFGDPRNGTALPGIPANKVMTICHPQDNICQGGDIIKEAHLTYSLNAGDAAMFALSGVAMLGISSANMVTTMAMAGMGI